MRAQTGLDQGVRDYVFDSPKTGEILRGRKYMLDNLLVRCGEEGKTSLVIAVGCTGGHHRSVAVAHDLADHIRALGYAVAENHRDMGKS